MLSATFITILASAVLTAAAPAVEDKRGVECTGTGAYYVCYNNGFRGACSVDPCAISWCPDYTPGTCTKTTTTTWTPPPVVVEKPKVVECTGTGAFYTCANNGFRGSCSVDPCALAWCPDYTANTCTKITTTWTPPPVVVEKPKTVECAGSSPYYVCANNGFRGSCSVDPCALAWCPDYTPSTCTKKTTTTTTWTPPVVAEEPKPKTAPVDPTVCKVGFFQVCASGFRGCCAQDACSLGYCPGV